MLKLTICEIMGANVDEQSFNNMVGIGSNGHDLGGNFRRRDWISSGLVGCKFAREDDVKGLRYKQFIWRKTVADGLYFSLEEPDESFSH